ncbi:hypothetical protein QPK87_06110 [Kamptonema cortianum]|nr:hypothetical protein [Geitlerinema splendidum]MDK3156148.1 hypothetical protein [Kamptonema cortianum]
MIFVKHFILLAALYALVPIAGRFVINRSNRAAGYAPIPYDWPFVVQCLVLGCLYPLAAQGAFEILTPALDPLPARIIALTLISLGYGAFWSLQEYMHGWAAVFLALVGGAATALLYGVIPYNEATQAFLAICLTTLPIFAIDAPKGPVRRALAVGRALLPIRGDVR